MRSKRGWKDAKERITFSPKKFTINLLVVKDMYASSPVSTISYKWGPSSGSGLNLVWLRHCTGCLIFLLKLDSSIFFAPHPPASCSRITVFWLIPPTVVVRYRSWAQELCLSRSNHHHLKAHSQQWSLLKTSIDVHLLLIHPTLTPERLVWISSHALAGKHAWVHLCLRVPTVCVCVTGGNGFDCILHTADKDQRALIVGIMSRDPIDL